MKQIEEGLQRLVASSVLRSRLPVHSVRELVEELRIDPATVANYQRLYDAGVFCVMGTFWPEVPQSEGGQSAPEC